jgi:hypothetical protein
LTHITKIFNINESNEFFVFKGGNVIKIWTLKKYIEKLCFFSPNNIQDLLSIKIGNNYDAQNFNTYSDYDFQYYVQDVENNKFNNEKYKKLLRNIYDKILSLRNNINIDLDVVIKNDQLNLYLKNNELHYNIQNFFENNGNIISNKTISDVNFMQNINQSLKVNSLIICNSNDKNIIYVLTEDHKIEITFNNTIITHINDFDLFRLKLNFNVNNNYKTDTFKSELFDLSILRPSDQTINEFCTNIKQNTNILNFKELQLRVYSILYVLKDILLLLFITNQPNQTIFLWNDVKYSKRIIRLGFLYANYLDELKNKISPNKKLDLTIIINNLNKLNFNDKSYIDNETYVFVLNYLIGYFIIQIRIEFEKIKNKLEMNVDKYNIFNDMINICMNQLNIYMLKLKLNNLLINIIKKYINNIISTYNNFNYNNFNINNFKLLINEYKFFDLMLSIYLLYLKSIFIDVNISWCSKYFYNDSIFDKNKLIDILNFKIMSFDFINLFVKNYVIGLQCQTNILEIINEPQNITDGANEIISNQNIANQNIANKTNYLNKETINNIYNKDNINPINIEEEKKFDNCNGKLLNYIKYAEKFYEYNEKNIYKETIIRFKNNEETIYIFNIIPKTFKEIYYYNNDLFDDYLKNQNLLVDNIFSN